MVSAAMLLSDRWVSQVGREFIDKRVSVLERELRLHEGVEPHILILAALSPR